jgi:hypothetical protein
MNVSIKGLKVELSGNQTYMEPRKRTVRLRQQVQHSHHADPNPKFSEP